MDKGRLFHYTVGIRINDIIADGVIKLETGGGLPFGKQRPAVWCTYSPKWEETCNKGLSIFGFHKKLDKFGTDKYCKGLYRIEVKKDSAPYNWKDWKRLSNVPKNVATSLLKVALKEGSDVELWRASFKPIHKDHWLAIESWNKKKDRWIEDAVLMWALNRSVD